MSDAVWFVSVERPGSRAQWDWADLGAPDPRALLPTRRPTSGDFSRHIPRRAYAATTGSTIDLESGLEHDLLRWLDQRPDVEWLVGQPVRLHFAVADRRRAVTHTPDLLSVSADGAVTLWDARPSARHDEGFLLKRELTAEECRKVGWRYAVFEGLPTPTRMNLLWLNGYRRAMPWHPVWASELQSVLADRELTVAELRARDDGSGELVATMWHLMAIGTIACDASKPIRERTPLRWSGGESKDDASQRLTSPPGTRAAFSDPLVGTRRRWVGR